ncbi:MAG: glycosyltransferase family 4 protein [Fimbriiglobus sp.]
MRVVMNGLAALKPKTGVGHHVVQLAAHLAAEFPAGPLTLYPGERTGGLAGQFLRRSKPARSSAGPMPANPLRSRLTSAAKNAGKAACAAHFAAYTRAFGFDLYHEPNFLPFPSRLPTVVTVHDLSVLRFPEWHPDDRVRLHARHFADGVRRAAHVITVSETVRREVIAHLGIPGDRVTAVYNGVNPAFRPQSPAEIDAVRSRHALPPRYFLCVGTIEPRKNLGTVLRAFADLPAAAREACPLVLAGPWGWKSAADRELFESLAGPRGARHLGYVPDADLPGLYAGAASLLYPSFYEGFGFPPVEMLACGGAVLASADPAVREVAGPHARYIDASDFVGWRDALHRTATDREFLPRHRAAGIEHARRFTWERAARDTHAAYHTALGHPAARPLSAAA